MRNSFVWWSTAAAITFGFSIAGLNTANAESVMRACASEWKQAQAAGTTGGQAWPQFLAQCRTRQGAAAPTAAPAPAPQSGSLFPWSQPSVPASPAASPATGQRVMRVCASQWKEAKAAGTTAGQTWPQFLSQCRARQTSTASSSGGFIPAPPLPRRPLPPPSQAPCSRGGNSRRPLPHPHRMSVRPRPCRRANTRRSSRRGLAARRIPSCGSTRRRGSIITRERATMGIRSRAPLCAKLMRARPGIAHRGTANARRRPIRDRRWRALKSLLVVLASEPRRAFARLRIGRTIRHQEVDPANQFAV